MSKVKNKELAGLADCSRGNVSNALRRGELDKDENGYIDLNDEKTKQFIARNLARKETERIESIHSVKSVTVTTEKKDITAELPAEISDAIERFNIAHAEKEEEAVVKLKLANATRRGQLLESDLVNRYVMVTWDRIRNANKREFADFINGFITDIQEGRKSRNELKRMASQMFDSWYYDAIHDLKEEVVKIEEEQAK